MDTQSGNYGLAYKLKMECTANPSGNFHPRLQAVYERLAVDDDCFFFPMTAWSKQTPFIVEAWVYKLAKKILRAIQKCRLVWHFMQIPPRFNYRLTGLDRYGSQPPIRNAAFIPQRAVAHPLTIYLLLTSQVYIN